ncbi:TMP-TENI-domain-containing protein [Patellaria atrata CBS 101060]|uniref:TMP-TENI-domain-containing protein n=1 Tax=Patellaria atrata CBS 101060 TaxID=1346257 RepID=A0A9P4S5W7_9PEZI|nr:TMP-TENI-domain-containing protein [Patellaria atrata CBS 101060]
MVNKDTVDYSLYLVTDSTKVILGDQDLVEVVEKAVKGGVTIVQYRDKVSETRDLIQTAKRLHEVTQAYNIPLLINDRVDVALAVGCEGVHIGQDDIDISSARRILGNNAIIGVTASSTEEALAAAEAGANYLGIGTVFATPTKENTKSIIGTAGVRSILGALSSLQTPPKTVCIGGINEDNVQRVLYQSVSINPPKSLDGIAVVSAIVSALDPEAAAKQLRSLIRTPPPFAIQVKKHKLMIEADENHVRLDLTFKPIVTELIKKLVDTNPICHNMTNTVVQNLAANVALAIGASPIMSLNPAEVPSLSHLASSLLLNLGTLTPSLLPIYTTALATYNRTGAPTILDPVGCGATPFRRSAVQHLLTHGYPTLIKGNASEILAVASIAGTDNLPEGATQRGVDNTASLPPEAKARVVKSLARTLRCLVLMTGSSDVLSDGHIVFSISNGNALLGEFTGSGCALGTAVAAVLAVGREDALMAVLAGVLVYEIAAQRAVAGGKVKGPGTFVPAWLDELYAIREETKAGEMGWVDNAWVEVWGEGRGWVMPWSVVSTLPIA